MGAGYPLLYQLNTRAWMSELARQIGRPAQLDDIPDEALDEIARRGFDWVWLLGVWQTGLAGRDISRSNADLRKEYLEALPDLQEEDIRGSPFAVQAYTVQQDLGGEAALARLRQRLRSRNIRLMLDFVPNHTALDHPWAFAHPEYYIQGGLDDLEREPWNYVRVESAHGKRVLARGRDPYFPGWLDTLQLNYGHAGLQEAMIQELEQIAKQCDGVRCDMVMLEMPEAFERTWGIRIPPFWPCAIERVRAQAAGFIFMAEVYWDMERQAQEQGFDYTYDKRLYDQLREGRPDLVREHLRAGMGLQHKMVHFLENHDERRAASVFAPRMQQAAAVLTFLAPGMRFFHQGQLEGRRVRIPVHLSRGPAEEPDQELQVFYRQLLALLQEPLLRQGNWCLLECLPAWAGNASWNHIVAYWWQNRRKQRMLVVVNYAAVQSQGYIQLPLDATAGFVTFSDRWLPVVYEREMEHLALQGLYVDMPPWAVNVFDVSVGELR